MMNSVNNDNNIFVLYHANCMDGLGAKFAAWTLYGKCANYIPVHYNEPLPQELLDRINEPNDIEVYIVDFSYDRETLDDLNSKVMKLIVLDHHKTALEALRGAPYAIFDMNKSGAVLAWEYFRPGVPVPKLLLHVQDRDLWKFKLDNTVEILLGFEPYKEDMEAWNQATFPKDFESVLESYRVKGETIKTFRDKQIKNTAKNATIISVPIDDPNRTNTETYKVALVNATDNISELGAYLNNSLDIDFSISYFIRSDGIVVLSFRSTAGGVDVSKIAEAFGGGGHPAAAGATVTIDVLQRLLNLNIELDDNSTTTLIDGLEVLG